MATPDLEAFGIQNQRLSPPEVVLSNHYTQNDEVESVPTKFNASPRTWRSACYHLHPLHPAGHPCQPFLTITRLFGMLRCSARATPWDLPSYHQPPLPVHQHPSHTMETSSSASGCSATNVLPGRVCWGCAGTLTSMLFRGSNALSADLPCMSTSRVKTLGLEVTLLFGLGLGLFAWKKPPVTFRSPEDDVVTASLSSFGDVWRRRPRRRLQVPLRG
jgi:hypothetical protein